MFWHCHLWTYYHNQNKVCISLPPASTQPSMSIYHCSFICILVSTPCINRMYSFFNGFFHSVQFFEIHPFHCMHLTVPSSVMWHGMRLTFYIKPTELSDTQIAGKALFLGVSVGVSWKRSASQLAEWVKESTLTEAGGSHSPAEGLYRVKRQRKNQLAVWAGTSIFSCPRWVIYNMLQLF